MKLLGRLAIERFYGKHADAKDQLLSLAAEIEAAHWQCFADIQQSYPKVSRIGSHYVFDVRGNRYRIDIKVAFHTQTAIVVRVGTHAEYDRWSFD